MVNELTSEGEKSEKETREWPCHLRLYNVYCQAKSRKKNRRRVNNKDDNRLW